MLTGDKSACRVRGEEISEKEQAEKSLVRSSTEPRTPARDSERETGGDPVTLTMRQNKIQREWEDGFPLILTEEYGIGRKISGVGAMAAKKVASGKWILWKRFFS